MAAPFRILELVAQLLRVRVHLHAEAGLAQLSAEGDVVVAPLSIEEGDQHVGGPRSRVTGPEFVHRCEEAVDACRLLAALTVGALHGYAKEELLDAEFAGRFAGLDGSDLAPAIDSVRQGDYKTMDRRQIRGTGYVVESIRAALWAFWNSTSFEEGALLAVNLGDDADTTGAVYGQLAGAHYGAAGLPATWLAILAWRDRIMDRADQLHTLAQVAADR